MNENGKVTCISSSLQIFNFLWTMITVTQTGYVLIMSKRKENKNTITAL